MLRLDADAFTVVGSVSSGGAQLSGVAVGSALPTVVVGSPATSVAEADAGAPSMVTAAATATIARVRVQRDRGARAAGRTCPREETAVCDMVTGPRVSRRETSRRSPGPSPRQSSL